MSTVDALPAGGLKTVSAVAGLPAADIGQTVDACRPCHRGSPEALAKLVNGGMEHVTPLDRHAGLDGLARWGAWKFFLLLILFNVTKDGAVVVLDLTRRLRGARNRGEV